MIRVLFVGLGSIGQRHFRNLAEILVAKAEAFQTGLMKHARQLMRELNLQRQSLQPRAVQVTLVTGVSDIRIRAQHQQL